MDHLSTPSDPAYPPTIVPCLSPLAYDRLDFQSYPERCGFTRSRLRSGDFSEQPPDQTAAFLQDWLCFGVLWATLGDAAVKSAYLAPHNHAHGRITTSLLDQHIVAYRDYIEHLRDADNALCWEFVTRAEKALEELDYFCCLTGRQSTSHEDHVQWPLPPEVDLSLRVLGQRITSAYRLIIGPMAWDQFRFWLYEFPGSSLAIDRMYKDNWCPSEVTIAKTQYSASTLYYMSMLKRPTTTRNHRLCTSRKCLAFQVDSISYKTKHATLHCDCLMLGPDYAEVTRIIAEGHIPIITIDVDIRKDIVKVTVEQFTNGMEYVAISHVWADGLGNNNMNSLPRCQLLNLKKSLDELRDQTRSAKLLNTGRLDALLRKKRHLSLRFWMDTLCIPVGKADKNLRTKAIKQMKEIYSNSQQVLVLDAELSLNHSSDSTEALTRISLSGWLRRLWTLQEGVLGKRLHFKFQNTILDLQTAYNESLVNNYKHKDFRSRMNDTRGTPSSDARQFFWKMRSLREQLFVEEPRKFMGRSTVSIPLTSAEDQLKRDEAKRCYGVMEAFEAARYRTTSRAEDVYPCLANLLSWDVADIGSVPAQRRIRVMLEQQTSLPQGILFIPGPRVDEHGWRWAVTDFDNDPGSLMSVRIQDSTPAIRTERGLEVEFPALYLPDSAKAKIQEASTTNGVLVIPQQPAPPLPSTGSDSTTAAPPPKTTWYSITPLPSQFTSTSSSSSIPSQPQFTPQPLPLLPTDTLLLPFYTQPTRSFFRRLRMPAVILAISPDDKPDILNPDLGLAVPGRFVGLAIVEILGDDGNKDEVVGRLGGGDGVGTEGERRRRVSVVEEGCGFVKRRWVVQ